MVRHGADGTERLRGLAVSLDGSGSICTDTSKVLVISFTSQEGLVLGVVRGVVRTADTIINMLAKVGGVAAHETTISIST